MKKRYAVLGNPIEHSLSPKLHALFAEQTGEKIEYDKQLIEIGCFNEQVQALVEQGYVGFNITVPFKADAYHWVDQPHTDTDFAHALNTIVINEDGSTHGYSTDGIGLVRDLTVNMKVQLAGKRVLLLGAGGAAKSVIINLLNEMPAELVVANRTLSKIEAMLDVVDITPSNIEDLDGHFDVVINATSAALSGDQFALPLGIINANSLCYDMVYNCGETAFFAWAKDHDSKVVDGLGMLVEQGAESFYLWRGVRPKTQSVIAQLA